MHHILLIDDDEQLGPPLATYFQRFELQLVHATRPSAGLALLRSGGFDAAILDVMLPEMDGFELCRTIRKENDIPIVMLTARGDVMDRVVGLELGADHYLPKPFEPRELLLRIQSLLRRRAVTPEPLAEVRFGPCVFHIERGELRRDGAMVKLTSSSASTPGKRLVMPEKVRKDMGWSALGLARCRTGGKPPSDAGCDRRWRSVEMV